MLAGVVAADHWWSRIAWTIQHTEMAVLLSLRMNFIESTYLIDTQLEQKYLDW